MIALGDGTHKPQKRSSNIDLINLTEAEVERKCDLWAASIRSGIHHREVRDKCNLLADAGASSHHCAQAKNQGNSQHLQWLFEGHLILSTLVSRCVLTSRALGFLVPFFALCCKILSGRPGSSANEVFVQDEGRRFKIQRPTSSAAR